MAGGEAPPELAALGVEVDHDLGEEAASPKTSSSSSRSRAASLSSMLMKSAPRSERTSRIATSRGRIIAAHASCRPARAPSGARNRSAYAKSLPVLYGGSV